MTYDVQLPAMMCNYTFYTYKINALESKYFIQEGNRTPVSKATHSRYREVT